MDSIRWVETCFCVLPKPERLEWWLVLHLLFSSLLSRLRNVKPLNLMSCSYEQKQVLYETANMSFSSQRASPSRFYNLIKNYLGKKNEVQYPYINSKWQGVDGHTLTLFRTIPEMCYLIMFWSCSGLHTRSWMIKKKPEICLFVDVFIFLLNTYKERIFENSCIYGSEKTRFEKYIRLWFALIHYCKFYQTWRILVCSRVERVPSLSS